MTKKSNRRDPLLSDLLPALERALRTGHTIATLADEAEVSIATLYFWRSGYVTQPRAETLRRVGKTVGLNLQWGRAR